MYIILALLLLDVLVIVHEGGHFWAARLCGIEVVEYAIGMGPLILQRTTKRNTKISLRLFPVGGYCMFVDEETGKDPRAFNNQALWKRAVTIFAGPLMNFIAAFFAIVIYLSVIGLNGAVSRVAITEPNAAEAGLLAGDTIIEVNGTAVASPVDISAAISACEGQTVTLTVERGQETKEIAISPFYDEAAGRWRVGFTFDQERQRVSLLYSLPFSVRYNAESATLIVKTLKALITRGQGVDEVTGPVGTVYAISEITRDGGIDIIFDLLAIISVNLGIMNLLPIPGLDGSRLLFLLVEAVRRKPISTEIEGRITMAGYALLIGLMLILTYKDILQIMTGSLLK
ncbi:MAG: site-2 protease family protein [Clostridia bacterium]|nr:site-2 protease family protein [Clostridia bacterium]